MMWNWLAQKLGRSAQVTRKKVDINIPYAQHSYRMEDFDNKTQNNTTQKPPSKFKSFN